MSHDIVNAALQVGFSSPPRIALPVNAYVPRVRQSETSVLGGIGTYSTI